MRWILLSQCRLPAPRHDPAGLDEDAGVTIPAGTDAGNYGTIQGFSIHRELLELVQAGLKPWQALAAATVRAGAGELRGCPYGAVAGAEANLVVLEASPMADIGNTQKIALVIHHGVIVQPGGGARRR